MRLGAAVAGALVAVALAFPAAGPGAAVQRSCSGAPFEQPFVRWLDPASYFLAAEGGFERGGLGWKLSGGAKAVSGNESFRVHSSVDSRSLLLPAGSSATSPFTCVTLDSPTIRLFVANGGSLLSTLQVDLLVDEGAAGVVVVPLPALTAAAAWQPTLPIPLLANLTALPVASNGTLPVALRFTPRGGGPWRIDDVYVDPFKGS